MGKVLVFRKSTSRIAMRESFLSVSPIILVLLMSLTLPGILQPVSADLAKLQVDVTTDRQFYSVGEPVRITILLTNLGGESATLSLGMGCQASFAVQDSSGVILYERMRHVFCTAALTQLVLFPGQRVEYVFIWDQLDDSGRQVDNGLLLVIGRILGGRVPFVVGFDSPPPPLSGLAEIVVGQLRATIDVRPGSDSNSINVRSQGTVPVAVLTTSAFDAGAVDPSTVRFGRTGVESVSVRSGIEDVDRDGDLDLVFHFNVQDTGLQAGDIQAILTGRTSQGMLFRGGGPVRVFFPGDVNRDLTVNLVDLDLVGATFMSTAGTRNWNLYADFNQDGTINVLDLVMVGRYFGQHA